MPQPGEVFVINNFKFEDGSVRDKWFVALNSSDFSNSCLALKTTSQPRRYAGCSLGCNRERRCFYAPTSWQPCFKIDTYIQLPQLFEFPVIELLKEKNAGNIQFIPIPLTNNCLADLKSCLARFKDDISLKHWKAIYR
jgi:hypothetical protein